MEFTRLGFFEPFKSQIPNSWFAIEFLGFQFHRIFISHLTWTGNQIISGFRNDLKDV